MSKATRCLVRIVGPKWMLHVGNVVSVCGLLVVMVFAGAPLWLLLPLAALAGACACNLMAVIGIRRDVAKEGWLDELDASTEAESR